MRNNKKVLVSGLAMSLALTAASSWVCSAKVTLTYWEKWGGFEQEIMQGIIDKFNKSQKDIQVKYVFMGDGYTKYLTACAAGTPPDIVGAWNHTLPLYVLNGVTQPLDQYLKLMNLSSKDFLPSYWDMMTYKGKMYGMPITPACFATFWNKTLFSEVGLDPESAPKTMEELLLMNDKLTKKDANGKIKQIGFSPSVPGWYPYMWPVAFGASTYDESKERVDFSQPGMVRYAKWVQAMSAKFGGPKGLSAFTNSSYFSKTGPFISGKMAIDIIGSFNPSHIAKYNPSLKYGVDELPVGQGGTQWSWLEGDVVFLPKGGKRNKEAAKFLAYLMSPEVQRDFQLKRETYSVVKSVNTPDFVKANKNPYIKEITRIASGTNGSYNPKTTAWDDLMNKVYFPLFDKIFGQTKSPEQALKEAQAIADPITARKAKQVKSK